MEEASSSTKGCLPKVANTWRAVFGALTSVNRIHPSDPIPPKDSEIISIESKIKIRVIHLTPEKVRQSLLMTQDASKRSSVSDEYWFMKNKPLRNTFCSCSFRSSIRRSHRNSNNFNGSSLQKDILSDKGGIEVASENSTIEKLEKFAEQLVEHTLNEAFNECLKNGHSEGVDNFAYEKSEIDSAFAHRNYSRKSNGKISRTSSPSNLKRCVHNRLKPLIMLIHGLGTTADIWNILMHNLSFNGFEVVAPDLLGHGFSSAPNKASLYQFTNILSQIMSVFDYFMKKDDKRKCILIGHSYGCSLITALYPNRATRIAQLILISGGGPTPLAPPADMNDISPYGWAHNLCYPFMYCGLKRSFFYSSRGKNFKFFEEESTVPPHLREFLIQGQYWPEGDASFHRRILAPTLLVHGLQDKSVTLVQECEMERTIPRSFLELIPDAGYMAMLESPEHLTHMISCFLEMWT
ncbi:protein ABHD8-like [Euwallacea similis]|uniref:protein ABHD8-like n=1 Tax=Euwallacea similis TaxID=1736056 RepID=UPI00344CAA6B